MYKKTLSQGCKRVFSGNWYYVQTSQYTEPVYAINSVVAANVSIPHATFTKVANWSIVERSGFSFVTGGGLYDIPVNGWYNITAQFSWNTPGNDNRYTLIKFSGNSNYRSKMMDFGSVTTTLRYLLAGTTVQFDVYQTSGETIAVEGHPERSVISIVKVA